MVRWERTRGFGYAEVYALLGALSFLVARFVPVLAFHVQCPMKAVAGIPCATCGMTHAFVHLAHGRLGEALAWSPAGALLAAAVWLLSAADLVRFAAGWPLPVVEGRILRRGVALGLVTLAVNWVYLVARTIA